MPIKTKPLSFIILITVFGGIALSSALGLWATKNDKIPEVYREGAVAGQYNPADIKGSYTFDDIQRNFDIPVAVLAQAFGVENPDTAGAFQCKELETIYAALADTGIEIGTGSVRAFVALYKGLPIDIEEGTALPASAAGVLKNLGTLSEQQISVVEAMAVNTEEAGSNAEPPEAPAPSAEEEHIIKGATTFDELLSWGAVKSDIEAIIKTTLPSGDTVIKDFASKQGVEFSEWKEQLQSLVQ